MEKDKAQPSVFGVTVKSPKRKDSIRVCLVYYYRGQYHVACGKTSKASNSTRLEYTALMKPWRAPVAFVVLHSDQSTVILSDIQDARIFPLGEPSTLPQIKLSNIKVKL